MGKQSKGKKQPIKSNRQTKSNRPQVRTNILTIMVSVYLMLG